MKEMTWDEYYAGFYDWSLTTQKSNSYRLSNFGDAEEVSEVVSEFAFDDQKFATRFLEKAFAAGVRFTPDQVLEMTIVIDMPVLSKVAEQTSIAFTKEQLEDIYLLIDDASFEYISKKQNMNIFADYEQEEIKEPEEDYEETDESEDDCDEMDEPEENDEEYIEPQVKRPGFFTMLLAAIVGADMLGGSNMKKHNGRCNGDCANCPPHYGYRYGRWYYGHDHVHGCEFGGNRGKGSMD